MGERGGHWQSVLGQQGGGAGACRQIPGRAVQPERRGETALPDGPAIKGRNTPARLPPRFPAPGKCTSHLGFGLGSQIFADTFSDLQNQRHSADYDPNAVFTVNQPTIWLAEAEVAIIDYLQVDRSERAYIAALTLIRGR